jgi:hypothetical protein
MNSPSNRLYTLLPAIYRIRDQAKGRPLEALLSIINHELQILETDIGDLYEDWFIETCDEWVVPYIGDLLDVRELYAETSQNNIQTYGQQERRAYVANTLAYRRRKGTAPILEQLARDVTGWRANVVEFFDRLAITQNIDYLRPQNRLVSIRQPDLPQLLGSPFEQQTAYTPDIRPISQQQGRYNVSNLGLFIWRLDSYPIEHVTAREVTHPESQHTGRYCTFSPLGYRHPKSYDNIPLFNSPRTETSITQFAEEIHLPIPLPRRQTFPGYIGPNPVLSVFINGQPQPIPPENVLITRLREGEGETTKPEDVNNWVAPTFPQGNESPAILTLDPQSGEFIPLDPVVQQYMVAVDPVSGRLAFLDRILPQQVEVSYAYGFSGDIGGGSYDRQEFMPLPLPQDSMLSPLYWDVPKATLTNPNPLGTISQIWNNMVASWQNCRELMSIPLARLLVPPVKIVRETTGIPEQDARPKFIPGMLNPEILMVSLQPGTSKLWVTVGSAIDKLGRRIDLDNNINVEVPEQRCQYNALLVLSYRSGQTDINWQLSIIPEPESDRYPADIYIRLAYLVMNEQGKLVEVIVNPTAVRPTLRLRPQFQAGIVDGLELEHYPGTMSMIVTAGKAVDRQGNPIDVTTNIQQDLSGYQDQTIVLMIAHDPNSAIQNWQLRVVPMSEEEKYLQNGYLRLERLYVPSAKIDEQPKNQQLALQAFGIEDELLLQEALPEVTPTYRPGIVYGLEVTGVIGDRRVRVAVGRAVDDQGRSITLGKSRWVGGLQRYCNKTVTLAIFHRGLRRGSDRKFVLFSADEAQQYPTDRYIRLASLQVSPTGSIIAPPISLHQMFHPGIAIGLTVKPTGVGAEVLIEKGTAVNSKGESLTLEQDCQVDLSTTPGRIFLLFISPQINQGWQPLNVTAHGRGQGWQQLGIVPVEPPTSQPGVILINDNRTYPGDLTFQIPAERQLQVIAASGYRPHLQGDLHIQGTAPTVGQRSLDVVEPEPGKLLLDGLLVEGRLTVLPGNLGELHVNHCTLVPIEGGMTVEQMVPEEDFPTDEEDFWSCMAFLMYCLNLLRRVMRFVVGVDRLSPQQALTHLFELARQELTRFFHEFAAVWQQQCSGWNTPVPDMPCLQPTKDRDQSDQNNRRLKMTVSHSIVGSVRLADTVPMLDINDSIVDIQGGTEAQNADADTAHERAIAAPGTQVMLERVTVLGRTIARQLEASDSLFAQLVQVKQRQVGCLRFCYVPEGSRTPRRYRCQPDLALMEAINELPKAITALVFSDNNQLLLAGTAGNGILRALKQATPSVTDQPPIASWERLTEGLTNLNITALAVSPVVPPATTNRIWAGTTGGRLFRSDNRGDSWTQVELNASLNSVVNSNITAIAFYQDIMIVGTAGNGVLRHSSSLGGWQLINQGLSHPTVTAIAISVDGQLFVGTMGGVFRSTDTGDSWTPINRGLSEQSITALVIHSQSGSGTISSQGLTITGNQTQFLQELRLGDRITASGQTRTIASITNDQTLTMDQPFHLEITDEKFYITSRADLFVATAGGGVFRSTNFGNSWESMNSGLTNLEVTTLVADVGSVAAAPLRQDASCPDATLPPLTVNSLIAGTAGSGLFKYSSQSNRWKPINNSIASRSITALAMTTNLNQNQLPLDILAGTAIGTIVYTANGGDRWSVLSQGIPNVDKMLLILNRLQTRFTTDQYGQPGYAQLGLNEPPEIWTGAEDQSEMGAFSSLKQPQRETNLRISLNEYLRFGLEVGIFYMT